MLVLVLRSSNPASRQKEQKPLNYPKTTFRRSLLSTRNKYAQNWHIAQKWNAARPVHRIIQPSNKIHKRIYQTIAPSPYYFPTMPHAYFVTIYVLFTITFCKFAIIAPSNKGNGQKCHACILDNSARKSSQAPIPHTSFPSKFPTKCILQTSFSLLFFVKKKFFFSTFADLVNSLLSGVGIP